MRFLQVVSSNSKFSQCQPLELLYNINVSEENGSEFQYSELFIGLSMAVAFGLQYISTAI